MIASALLCLATNAYHEARSEPFHGQVAVSQVVLRRAGHDPKKVCKVVHKHKQFSWTLDKRRKVRDPVAWRRALEAAKVALIWNSGAKMVDYSNGADHYHASYVAPRWAKSLKRVAVIGQHVFYRRVH